MSFFYYFSCLDTLAAFFIGFVFVEIGSTIWEGVGSLDGTPFFERVNYALMFEGFR